MTYRFFHIRLLLKRLSVVLLIYTLCRLLFLAFNWQGFKESGTDEISIALLHGLRFDISALMYINSVFILLSVLEQFLPDSRRLKVWQQWSYMVPNTIGVFLNLIDIEYYKFQKKRTTFELFSGENDVMKMLPEYLKSYWYLLLILVPLTVFMWVAYRRMNRSNAEFKKFYAIKTIVSVLLMGMVIMAMRGGLQTKPIQMITASYYGSPRNAALVLNTPFTIFQSLGKKTLTNPAYFAPAEADSIFSIRRNYKGSYEFQKKNVVVIILESFSSEWVGSLSGKKSYAPFLDSLVSQGLTFSHSYANGKKSNEALPSIMASLPSLMDETFSNSVYQDNELRALPKILKEKGYYTAFYHGGLNGTMNFDAFARKAGVDKYFGMNEYPNRADYDGNWGIYDEPYFQYFCSELSSAPKPFFAGIFSLSSHHPYSLPKEYAHAFDDAETPMLKTLRYTDQALKKFFEKASKTRWFYNTVFVITADHTSASDDPLYNSYPGYYKVPIIFYEPGTDHLKGRREELVQQTDIMPSVLDYLGYDEPFTAFGESVFSPRKYQAVVQYLNGVYQVLDSTYAMSFSDGKPMALYRYHTDPLLKENIISTEPEVTGNLEKKIKAFIQVYNTRMSENKLTGN